MCDLCNKCDFISMESKWSHKDNLTNKCDWCNLCDFKKKYLYKKNKYCNMCDWTNNMFPLNVQDPHSLKNTEKSHRRETLHLLSAAKSSNDKNLKKKIHLSLVTCNLSPFTYHLSFVTCHNLKTESALLANLVKEGCKLRWNRKLFQEYFIVLSVTNRLFDR